MSMNYGIEENLGIIIPESEFMKLLGLPDADIVNYGSGNIWEIFEEKFGDVIFIGSDELYVNGYKISPDGSMQFEYEEGEEYIVLPATFCVNSNNFFKPNYNSFDELKKDLVNLYGSKLPEWFDIDAHIGYIEWVYFG